MGFLTHHNDRNHFRQPEKPKATPIGVVGGQDCPPYNKTCGFAVGWEPTLQLN
ncbi:MAG: hypothetical protein IKH45_08925 [Neisseriaceae bacterium]|nr:hypothetical protein [Neisseriaceae bacterium]